MLCYILVFCVLICWCICLSCVLRVCELFGEIIRNMFWCGCYFAVECYGCVQCGWRWRCSVGYTVYGLPKNVCVEPVIPVCI